jgi:hypothetical protein
MDASVDLSICRRFSHALGETAGTELHCDMAGLVVGPKFRGIKMIPPGLHLFCWDAGQDKVGLGRARLPLRVLVRARSLHLRVRPPCAADATAAVTERRVAGISSGQNHV